VANAYKASQTGCPALSLNAPSSTPYMGGSLLSGPQNGGGAQPMLAIGQPCQCSQSCCGAGGSGGPPGGGGPGGSPPRWGSL
jgi:hypothetical protein